MKSARIIAALVLAVAAAAGNFAFLEALEDERRGGELIPVVATSRNVTAGAALSPQDLAERRVPRAYVDERAVLAKDKDGAIGALMAFDVRAGGTLLWSDLGKAASRGPDLAGSLASGQRAMTIRVDRSLSLAGLLQPGHRVDILCTLFEQRREGLTTVTVLQNVPVLATGERTQSAAPSATSGAVFDTVTLSVAVDQAQRLALAAAAGKLSLVLRGHDDLSLNRELPHAKVQDLSGSSPGRPPSAAADRGGAAHAIERLLAR